MTDHAQTLGAGVASLLIAASTSTAAASTLNTGSIQLNGFADSAVPTYFFSAVDDDFDTVGEFSTIRFASVRSAIAGFNGSVGLTDDGASASIDLFSGGAFGDSSTGSSSATYTASFTLDEQSEVSLLFDSTWVIGGGAGGAGYVTTEYSFGDAIAGSFDSRGRSDAQGLIDDAFTAILDAGTYTFDLSAEAFSPDQSSRLFLGFALGFTPVAVPTPGATAIALIGGVVLLGKRRGR